MYVGSGFSVAGLLCKCVGGFMCGACFVITCICASYFCGASRVEGRRGCGGVGVGEEAGVGAA